MSIECCSASSDIFSDWVIPEGYIHRRFLGDFYEKNPIKARVLAAPVAVISGMIKVFLFPLICLVGVVVMPIIAAVKACRNEKDAGDWLKACVFCVIGLTASIAFIAVACYYLPLITSAGLIVAFMAISIVIHVYKLVKEPVAPSPIDFFRN